MAPRGRRKKAGLMRVDGAREAMRPYGFDERLVNVCIKELLEVYGEEGWFLIEECSYTVLLNKCIEKSEEQDQNLGEDKREEMVEEQSDEMVETEQEQTEEQNDEIVDAKQEQTLQEEEEKEQEQEHEHEQQVEDGRDHVGSNSTSLAGCGAEISTKTCQTDALSLTSETEILDSSPAAGEASVIDDASPVAFPSANASGDFGQHSVGGAKSSCGWLSEEDETDPDEDSVGDDDEIIQLTPQPLCEELEELIKEVRGEKKKRTRKRTREWDK